MATPDLTNQVATDINNMKLLLTPRGTDTTTRSTSGTGEDDLSSFTLTGGDLANTGVLEVWGSGDMTGQNDVKMVQFHLGSSKWPLFTTRVAGKWEAKVTIMLISASSQRITFNTTTACYGVSPGYTDHYINYETASINTASNITIKFTGECKNASDTINQYMMLSKQLKIG